jgi:hypothetical protein
MMCGGVADASEKKLITKNVIKKKMEGGFSTRLG